MRLCIDIYICFVAKVEIQTQSKISTTKTFVRESSSRRAMPHSLERFTPATATSLAPLRS